MDAAEKLWAKVDLENLVQKFVATTTAAMAIADAKGVILWCNERLADTEFGAKLSVSLVNGYSFVDRTSWDNFNECLDLKDQVEAYKRRFGVYPESVHADRIYRTRDNLRYCKKHNIRLSGPRFGRPPKMTPENESRLKAEAAIARQDERDRIPIEGKFGQAKRRYGIGRVMTKLASTSETAISLCFLVMNLERWLKAIFLCLFFKEQKSNSEVKIVTCNCTRAPKIAICTAF